MIERLSYAAFHLLFVLPPIAVLAVALVRSKRLSRPREAVYGIVLLAAIAAVYTTPWDNYLIEIGVWRYQANSVLGRVGAIPVEEYAFFVLQPVLAGLWFNWLGYTPTPETRVGTETRLGALLFWAAITAGGVWLLMAEGGLYLGAIAVWAAPVAALQWALGGPVLARNGGLLLGAIAVPTLYLCVIDRIAIGLGIWQFSGRHITGLAIGGLPVEEGAFFLVTTVLVVQGLLLFHWVLARVRAGGVRYGLAGLVPTARLTRATTEATTADPSDNGPESHDPGTEAEGESNA